MKVLVCEICENQGLTKVGEMFECPACGAKYAVADAKKLLKEVEDGVSAAPVVPVETGKYLKLARQAAQAGNSAEAAKYYSMAKEEYPDSWECVFYSNYYAAAETTNAGIAVAAGMMTNTIGMVLELLEKLSIQERVNAVGELTRDVMLLCKAFVSATRECYSSSDYARECRDRELASVKMLCALVDGVYTRFPNEPGTCESVAIANQLILNYNDQINWLYDNDVIAYLEKMGKYDMKNAEPMIRKHKDRYQKKVNELSVPLKKSNSFLWFVLVITGCCLAVGGAVLAVMSFSFEDGAMTLLIGVAWVVIGVPMMIRYWKKCMLPPVTQEDVDKQPQRLRFYTGCLERVQKILGEQ